MEGFEDCHEEFLKPLMASFDLLKRDNVFLYKRNRSFLSYWRSFYMITLVVLQYIGLSVFIVKLFTKGGDLFEKADTIPIWIVFTENVIKYVLLINKRTEIKKVVDYVASIWRTEGLTEKQLKIKNDALKRLHYGQFVFVKAGLVISWQYLLMPLYVTTIRRLILNQDVELQLPLGCAYPFEINNWFIYIAVYIIQVYSCFRSAHIYLGFGWLLVVLISHLNVLFLLLQEDLIDIKPTRAHRRRNNSYYQNMDEITEYYERPQLRIEDFVRRHQDTILSVDKLNASCYTLTFTTLLFSTLLICFFAVAAKVSTGTAYAINNYGAILVIMSNIFILCYCSQLLSSSSSGIALAAAKNIWYKGSLRHQTNIRFIIMRSQKPCSLTSLASSPIGLETFNKVLKTTWSYFSLASQLYDERD